MSIRLHDISKAYAGHAVIEGLTLDLPECGLIGLSGPSGCGKTTLLRLLAGLDQPDSGTIDGLANQTISMVFQEDRLLPWLSALDNIAIVLGNRDKARIWLEHVRLDSFGDYYPAELSGGMKRRVALARALARPGNLMLLDEPFTGMDAELKTSLFDLLRRAAEDRPVILVTHDISDINQLSDLLLNAEGPPLNLTRVEK